MNYGVKELHLESIIFYQHMFRWHIIKMENVEVKVNENVN